MRRVPTGFLILLFAAFLVLTFVASVSDVSDNEARLRWIVRDPEKVEPAAIGDTARLLLRNFQTMIDRTKVNHFGLVATVPLDVWTTAAGGSIFAARLLVVLLVCLAAAVAYRFARTRVRLGMAAAITVFVLAFVQSCALTNTIPSPLAEAVSAYLDERQLTEPVITLFRDDSPLGYYQAQVNLRRGIGLDLGWRTFSEQEIQQIVDAVGDASIWLLFDLQNDFDRRVSERLLSEGRNVTWCSASGSRRLMRFELGSGDTAVCPETLNIID